jgi:membrane fusion protein (multidrug efflux system)
LGKLVGLLIVLAAAGVVLVLVVALPAKSRDVPPTDPPAVNVRVEVVEPKAELADTIVLHGVVEPNRMVKVAAEVSGQIDALGRRKTQLIREGRSFAPGDPLDEGEPVTKGDELIILNTDLLQAEYDRVKAQAEYDAREYERTQTLFERRVATKGELDQVQTRMAVSQAALVEAAKRLEKATITAPISGILNCLPEEVGQFVQPGTCIAEIVDMSVAKVVVDVPEKDVHYFGVGDVARVLIDPLGDREVDGKITFISELAAEQTRTTRIEISVANGERLLRSGQIVRAELTRRILNDVIMIPLESVIPLEEGRVVYVVEGDSARRREVKLGFFRGTRVRVTEGLAAGDQLIVSGHRFVGEGQKVRVDNLQATSRAVPQGERE